MRNPTELKNIKNISLLRQMSPTNLKPPTQIIPNVTIKPEPVESESDLNRDFEDKPTDLSISMEGPTDLSNNNRHVNIICSPDPPIPPQHH